MARVKTSTNPPQYINRTGIILILASLIAMGPLTIDMYLPAFPDIEHDLGTTNSKVVLTMTSYFFGIALGQLFYGPLMDRFGRKGPLMVGLSLYLVASIVSCLSPDINSLIGARLLQALGGCAGMVASRAMVRDLFPVKETAKVFSTLILIMGIAPMVAPTLGGVVVEALGWRAVFVILGGFSLLILLIIFFLTPESKGPDKEFSLMPGSVLKKYLEVGRNPIFLVYGLAGAFGMAAMFAYISGSPYVIMEYLGFSETEFGWIFGANAMSFILGSQVNRIVLRNVSTERVTLFSGVSSFLAGLMLVIGLASGLMPRIGILFLLSFLLFGLGFFAPNTMALALAPFKRLAGSAAALVGTIRMLTGAIATALVSELHNDSPLPMAIVIGGFSTLSLICLLYVFWRKQPSMLVAGAEQ